MILDQLKKLQRRYESTEEELHKKRAELREALRNDTVPIVSTLSTRHPRVAGEPGSMAEPDYTHKKYSSTLPKMELQSPGFRFRFLYERYFYTGKIFPSMVSSLL